MTKNAIKKDFTQSDRIKRLIDRSDRYYAEGRRSQYVENSKKMVYMWRPTTEKYAKILGFPFGDYDNRLSHDGQKIIFSRLENDRSVDGNYNFFIINIDGSNETRLSDNGFTQGLTSLSNSGDKILFIVSAINDVGKYDIYIMNSNGTGVRNITPDYFPNDFLCRSAVFSNDDSIIYFVGEWWES